MTGERFDPKHAAPKDAQQQPQEKGDSGAAKISFSDVHDGRTEAVKPGESTIDKLERGIAATTAALTESLASIGEKFKALAQLPEDHEHHPNQALKQYAKSESHQDLLAVASGKKPVSEIAQTKAS